MRRARSLVALLLVVLVAPFAGADDWLELDPNNTPGARFGHTIVDIEGELYLFGGGTTVPLNDLWKWDVEAGNWIEIMPSIPPGASAPVLPPGRHNHTVAVVGYRMYVMFGLTLGGSVLADVWVYDVMTNLWSQVPSRGAAPPSRAYSTAVTIGQDIYIVGGLQASNNLNDCWRLDTAGGGWTKRASLPSGRYSASSASVGSRMVIFGGGTGGHPLPSTPAAAPTPTAVLNEILSFDPEKNLWVREELEGDVPQGRTLAMAAAFGDVMWILGGLSESARDLGDVWEFDFRQGVSRRLTPVEPDGTSTRRRDMPITLSDSAGGTLGGATRKRAGGQVELIVYGGRNRNALQNRMFLYTSDLEQELVETVYVNAAAHAEGVGGAQWRTDLELANRGDSDALVTIELLRSNVANPDPMTAEVIVGAGSAQRLGDVFVSAFNTDGSGALCLRINGGDVLVTSRTYRDSAEGTYGQFIAGVSATESVPYDRDVRLIQLSRSADSLTGFRTNIGFVNTSDLAIEIEVDLYSASRTFYGTKTVTVEPRSHRQVTDIYGTITDADVPEGFAVVRTVTEGGRFFTYASVVDNKTGDPIYVSAQ